MSSRFAPKEILQYEDDPGAVYEAVNRQASRLKIVLKIKNDPIFLKDWLDHHGKIVGYENLIVADNMSTDQEVFEIYQQYLDRSVIFQFSGSHNGLHRESRYPFLYRALYDSAEFLQVLDADERLVALFDDYVLDDERLLDTLPDPNAPSPLLGVFFFNKPHMRDTFRISRSQGSRLLWAGKSVFPSAMRRRFPADRGVNHNHEIPDAESFLAHVDSTRFGILHLTQLNFEQRIRSNREKLASRGLVSSDTPFEDIAAMEFSVSYANTLVEEIREGLRRLDEKIDFVSGRLGANDFRIESDRSISFGSEAARQTYLNILHEPAALLFTEEGRQHLQASLNRRGISPPKI